MARRMELSLTPRLSASHDYFAFLFNLSALYTSSTNCEGNSGILKDEGFLKVFDQKWSDLAFFVTIFVTIFHERDETKRILY